MYTENIREEENINELEAVLLAGKILIGSGAEIYRTEETMRHIAEAMKMKQMEAYVTVKGIFVSGRMPGKPVETRISNIPETNMNIDRIEAVNELSRSVCSNPPDVRTLWAELNAISGRQGYGILVRTLSYALGAGGFSYAMGTSLRDAICATIIGTFIGLYMTWAQDKLKSRVLIIIIASAMIAVLGNLLTAVGIGQRLPHIILGAMMDLVPGVAFVNAVREFSQNNVYTGITLLMSALLVCVSMASGVVLVQLVIPGAGQLPYIANDIMSIQYRYLIARSLAAGLGTVAFAVMFGVRREHFIDCGILGAISWLAYMVLSRLRYTELPAVFVSCFLVVMASRILAVLRKCPITVFLMTSLFPLLPGISFYRSVYYMLTGNDELSMRFAMECFLIAFTIAVSIAIVQQLPKGLRLRIKR